jgi:hypothetical protein
MLDHSTIQHSRWHMSSLTFLLQGMETLEDDTPTKLDFIQLCGIAHRINEAFEQCARYFYHVGCL